MKEKRAQKPRQHEGHGNADGQPGEREPCSLAHDQGVDLRRARPDRHADFSAIPGVRRATTYETTP